MKRKDQNETVTFRRGSLEELPNGLLRQKILVGRRAQTWFVLRREGIALAAAWDDRQGFLPLPAYLPRLYIDFPLIGSESFPFPVVLNSLNLRPNEPRSNISLVEHEESLDARENRALLDMAVALYREFFSALLALDRRGVENLLRIPPWAERKEWSAGWVRQHLCQTLYDFISYQPLLPAGGAYHALAEPNIRLVQAGTPEQRTALAALWRQIQEILVPEGATDWCGVLGNYGLPEGVYVTVRSALENASSVLVHGFCPGTDPALWLATLYNLGMETEETAIRAGEFSLFPSQNPEDLASGRLYSAREICQDPGIPELLKDCTEKLDELESQGRLELRRRLLHRNFRLETPLFLPEISVAELSDYIITRSNRGFRVRGYGQRADFFNETWASAWSLLLAAGPDRELYELCRSGWRELPDYAGVDQRFDGRMWINAYRGVLGLLLEELKAAGTLAEWTKTLAVRAPGGNVIEWLEMFYAKVSKYLQVSELFFTPILPNQ